MLDYIQIFICIITSVVYLILSLIIGQSGNQTLLRLIYVIIISYIAGLILRTYLKRNVFDKEKENTGENADISINDGIGEGYDFDEDED